MPINQLDNNGKSKIISHKTGVFNSKGAGLSDKANTSAPSHSKRPIVNLGHARHPNTGSDNEGRSHEAKESSSFERGEDKASVTTKSKVVSDRMSGGKGMKGSY